MTPWELHILDVGQGSSVVLVLPSQNPQSREAIVVDSADATATLDCLESRGVTSLPLVLITHSDDDHARGIPGIVEAYWGSIGKIAFNIDTKEVANKPWFDELYPLLQGRSPKDQYRPSHAPAQAGCWPLCRLHPDHGVEEEYGELLYPTPQDVMDAFMGSDPNYASAILSLKLAGFRALLGADLSITGWSILWSRLKQEHPDALRADLLVYSHHGADIQTPATAQLNRPAPPLTDLELLQLISPSIVLISAGTTQPGNYQHPRPVTLELLAHYREECRDEHRPFRLACTELTTRCHPAPITLKPDALRILAQEQVDAGYARDHVGACPCAATFSLSISPDDGTYQFLPNAAHQEFVDLVDSRGGTPRCRLVVS